jgi:hypothetical protein
VPGRPDAVLLLLEDALVAVGIELADVRRAPDVDHRARREDAVLEPVIDDVLRPVDVQLMEIVGDELLELDDRDGFLGGEPAHLLSP